MERYGRDYGRGRRRHPGFRGYRGYDEDFGAGYSESPGYRTPPMRSGWGGQRPGRNGWDSFDDGYERWGAREDLRNTFPLRNEARFDQEGWGQPRPRWLRHGYDDSFGSGTGRYGYSSGGRHFRGPREEYDHDFMDRLRRGWNHFRDETRSRLHRGYDRDW
jgi:hypothetical protein